MEDLATNNITSALKEAMDAGAAMVGPIGLDGSKTPLAVLPEGYRVEDLSEFLDRPSRIAKKISLRDVDSLMAYFDKYHDDETVIFADEDDLRFEIIFDYHSPGWANNCSHIAALELSKTDEWETWLRNNKQQCTQATFAQFIEDNLPDITSFDGRYPSSADMLEVSRSLEAKTKVDFVSSTRLEDGGVEFRYKEEVDGTTGKGGIKIPEIFAIGISPYHGCDPYIIEARFRYRINSGKLSIWYDLVRPHKVREDAFSKECQKIKARVGDTPIYNR